MRKVGPEMRPIRLVVYAEPCNSCKGAQGWESGFYFNSPRKMLKSLGQMGNQAQESYTG